MNKVNTYCNGVSVRHKITITVIMDLVFDPDRLRSELGARLDRKARVEGLPINPSHLAVCEVKRDQSSRKRFFVSYPPSLPDIEKVVLEVLAEIEADVKTVVEANRLQSLLLNAQSD